MGLRIFLSVFFESGKYQTTNCTLIRRFIYEGVIKRSDVSSRVLAFLMETMTVVVPLGNPMLLYKKLANCFELDNTALVFLYFLHNSSHLTTEVIILILIYGLNFFSY